MASALDTVDQQHSPTSEAGTIVKLKEGVSVSEKTLVPVKIESGPSGNGKNAETNPRPPQDEREGNKKAEKRVTGAETLKRLRLSTHWLILAILIAVILGIVLAVDKDHQHNIVAPSGILLYVEIAWCSLLLSYVAVTLVDCIWRQCIRALDMEDLEAYIDFMTNIKFSTTVLVAVIVWLVVSHTDILCFHDPNICKAPWIPKLQHALLASVLVSAAFFIKAILVELAISRTALRSLYTKRLRTNQVMDAVAWVLGVLEPETDKDRANDKSDTDGYSGWLIRTAIRIVFKMRFRNPLSFLLLRHRPGENAFDWMKDAEFGKDAKEDEAATDAKTTDHPENVADDDDDEEDSEDDNEEEEDVQRRTIMTEFKLSLCFRKGFSWNQMARITKGKCDKSSKSIKEINDMYRIQVWEEKRKSGHRRKALSPRQLMKLLDADNDDFITLSECLELLEEEVVPSIVENNRGLDGIRRAARDVDVILSIILLCAAALIYTAFFVKDFSTYTAPVWTGFTGLGFALGGTITEFLASCFFVFCKQPYDVGDRVRIDGKDLLVEEIHLNYTVFKQVDGFTIQQICHSKLLEMWIANKTRTKTQYYTDHIKLPGKCDCADAKVVQNKMDGILVKNKDCRRHLEKGDGLQLREVTKRDDGSWKLEIRFKYREKLVYRETDLAECREALRADLENLLSQISEEEKKPSE